MEDDFQILFLSCGVFDIYSLPSILIVVMLKIIAYRLAHFLGRATKMAYQGLLFEVSCGLHEVGLVLFPDI